MKNENMKIFTKSIGTKKKYVYVFKGEGNCGGNKIITLIK